MNEDGLAVQYLRPIYTSWRSALQCGRPLRWAVVEKFLLQHKCNGLPAAENTTSVKVPLMGSNNLNSGTNERFPSTLSIDIHALSFHIFYYKSYNVVCTYSYTLLLSAKCNLCSSLNHLDFKCTLFCFSIKQRGIF